ncbi:hypothetical protein [Streptomyces chromofuscus]|uniref:Uncharacterized protein n=1 Tax=Streptomyces chromofuscus TaxID=42881 RepID=A0A7M2T2E0_STRCW|nr:hypothetical protein [Streptomyces chromofuscus]QOV42339.1 hypothetical protein IPT68_21115 [Streptomyces chromofuscus]GGT34718.1 hypothetical protein GCM10010254_63990 [Streptomyces chromofuscus]
MPRTAVATGPESLATRRRPPLPGRDLPGRPRGLPTRRRHPAGRGHAAMFAVPPEGMPRAAQWTTFASATTAAFATPLASAGRTAGNRAVAPRPRPTVHPVP